MAMIFEQESRTFSEYLLVPNLTTRDNTPENVDLSTAIVRYRKGEEKSRLSINIPLVSAVMQAVSDDGMAIALSRSGGLSFIYASQSVESQAEMVSKVKKYKAGFVTSDSNVTPDATLADVLAIKARTGHSTIAVTADGTANGRLLGIVTSRDYRISRTLPGTPVRSFMTPFDHLVYAREGINLSEANDIIWEHKLNSLPIIDKDQRLQYLVFRKDYDDHKQNPAQLMDSKKRLVVGAGINTRDYNERVPALLDAEVDILCVDSSDGFTEFQRETIQTIKKKYPDVKIGGGNVVDREGFMYLVESGADFVKVGIGGGSICITREQKGIGRGQASAVIEVAKARDEYYEKTGIYIPLCSDGGIVHDYHVTLALAMGADFVMMGRYFARFDESPTKKVKRGNSYVKEYWGEGSNRARNWQRYDLGGNANMKFEEGVDSYVPYAGKLKDNLDVTLNKIRATMSSCGAKSIRQLQETARIVLVSSTSLIEGGAHDVILKDSEY